MRFYNLLSIKLFYLTTVKIVKNVSSLHKKDLKLLRPGVYSPIIPSVNTHSMYTSYISNRFRNTKHPSNQIRIKGAYYNNYKGVESDTVFKLAIRHVKYVA